MPLLAALIGLSSSRFPSGWSRPHGSHGSLHPADSRLTLRDIYGLLVTLIFLTELHSKGNVMGRA